MITIYARKDLGYRRGKMAAQSAHALMKLMLESFNKEGQQLQCELERYKYCFELASRPSQVKIEWVNSIEEIHELEKKHGLYATTIIDSGKTESNGVPTLTCLAVDNKQILKRVRTVEFEENLYGCKQILVMRSDLKIKKEQHLSEAASLSCLTLIKAFDKCESGKGLILNLDEPKHKMLSSWLSGAFAKIGVKCVSNVAMIEVSEAALKKSIPLQSFTSNEHQVTAFSVGPCPADLLNGVTNHLKLY